MKGTLATSGLAGHNCRVARHGRNASLIMPSSMQMSITFRAASSTCCRATLTASSNLPSSHVSLANFGDPATLVRSPIMM